MLILVGITTLEMDRHQAIGLVDLWQTYNTYIFATKFIGDTIEMSLDIVFKIDTGAGNLIEVLQFNITHNLAKMAKECGLYLSLWGNGYSEFKYAWQLTDILKAGVDELNGDREYYEQFNPENGWGNYDTLLELATTVLQACVDHPNCRVYSFG